jgi:hypothetical protein
MRTLTLMAGASGYRLAFVGPGDRFEVIARFTSWDAAAAAHRAAQEAAALVLNGTYLTPRKAA